LPTPQNRGPWQSAARYSTVGIEMVVSMTIAILGGRWLDEQLDTAPYIFFVGLAVGIAAAFKPIVRIVRQQ